MIENKVSGYLLRCPRISIGSFINKFYASNHEWNYKYENHSIFHSIRALTLIFIEKTKKLQEMTFFPKRRIVSFQSSEREREKERDLNPLFIYLLQQFLGSFKIPKNYSPISFYLLGQIGSAHLGTQTHLQHSYNMFYITLNLFNKIFII